MKGGQEIGRDTEGWYSVPHGVPTVSGSRTLGCKAQNAAHKLGHLLREDELLRRISYGWAVAFPGAHVDVELGPSLPRDLVIDRGDLATIEAAVSRVFDRAKVSGPALSVAGRKAFVDVLAPCFQLAPALDPLVRPTRPLGELLPHEERELLRLTEEQMAVLEFVPDLPRVVIRGAAGTALAKAVEDVLLGARCGLARSSWIHRRHWLPYATTQ